MKVAEKAATRLSHSEVTQSSFTADLKATQE